MVVTDLMWCIVVWVGFWLSFGGFVLYFNPGDHPLRMNECGAVCQYSHDVGMPEHSCSGECYYSMTLWEWITIRFRSIGMVIKMRLRSLGLRTGS